MDMSLTVVMGSVSRSFCSFLAGREGGRERGAHPSRERPPVPLFSWEKALTLWVNSSLGILTMLANRTSTEGAWVALKKTDLAVLSVLDVRALTAGQLQGLVDLFDLVEKMEFERLPQMADCPARRALDDGLSSILGLPDLSGLCELLATESVVSDERL